MAIRLAKTVQKLRKVKISDYAALDDNRLLALFRDGDTHAFQALMNRHRGVILRVVRQYLGGVDDADDVFQDICLTFYQNRDVYQAGAAKFSSWLYRVAVNKCLDILRSRQGKPHSVVLDDDIPSLCPTAEDIVRTCQLSSLVKELLATLPQQQRLALSLYYMHEQDVTSISVRMEVTEGAARALIKRGRNNLRAQAGLSDLSSDYI